MTPAASPIRPKSRLRLLGILAASGLIAGTLSGNESPAALSSTPLAARSGPRGPTLFTTLPSALTGLKAFNAYDDPAMWGRLYQEFNTGAIGSGVAAGDFDGDGRADLLLVGNSYAPIPETGRFDGGLGWLLRGDGAGGFTPLAPDESGFVVPGDARALAQLDLDQDGWPDALATRSNAPALAFLNRKRPGRHSFGVALRGPPGNPAAVGARLTLQLADGSSQSGEVGAGSGYLTQTSATTFFGYPDTAPPVRLRVRWPDGRETDHAFPTTPPTLLRLAQP